MSDSPSTRVAASVLASIIGDGSGGDSGDGSGDDSGDGSGNDSGDGSADGSGDGNTDGSGYDSGDGSGNDSGDGSGSDSGDGSGNDSGDGSGDDSGDGGGDDSGGGSGNISGDGSGDDSGDGSGNDGGDGSGNDGGDGSGNDGGDDSGDGSGNDSGDGSGDDRDDDSGDDDTGNESTSGSISAPTIISSNTGMPLFVRPTVSRNSSESTIHLPSITASALSRVSSSVLPTPSLSIPPFSRSFEGTSKLTPVRLTQFKTSAPATISPSVDSNFREYTTASLRLLQPGHSSLSKSRVSATFSASVIHPVTGRTFFILWLDFISFTPLVNRAVLFCPIVSLHQSVLRGSYSIITHRYFC